MYLLILALDYLLRQPQTSSEVRMGVEVVAALVLVAILVSLISGVCGWWVTMTRE